jgi:hypothetical protein
VDAKAAEQEQQQVGDAHALLLVGDGGLDQDAPLRPLGGAAQIVILCQRLIAYDVKSPSQR